MKRRRDHEEMEIKRSRDHEEIKRWRDHEEMKKEKRKNKVDCGNFGVTSRRKDDNRRKGIRRGHRKG